MRSIIPVFIPHVGCPHDCVFCNQRKIAGAMSAPSPAEISDIIDESLSKCGGTAECVAFYGGSFTAIDEKLQNAYLAAAQRFVDDGKIGEIRFSTRPDCITEEILDNISRFSVGTIELGAQSMDDAVLCLSGRGHTAEATTYAARLIKARGFKLILQMMTQLPGGNDEEARATAHALCALAPDGVRIYPVVVVADTALETLWRSGKYIPTSPEQAAELGADLLEIFENNGISVIRFGLNPTDDLSGGAALAGAYHPSLGELAKSALYLRRARAAIAKLGDVRDVKLLVHPSRVSVMVGQHKRNKRALVSEFGLRTLKIRAESDIPSDTVRAVGSKL